MNKKEPIKIKELNCSNDLFGIDNSIFHEILQQGNSEICIKKIAQVDCINRDYYGGRGEKVVLKIDYNEDGINKDITLFIKRHCESSPNEAVHYKYLTQFNAPIPELYSYYSNKNCQDIIISEIVKPFYVDDEPIFMLNKDILKPFIEVTALFNSIPINDEYKKIISNGYSLLNNKLKPYHDKLIKMFDTIKTDSTYRNLQKQFTKTIENKVLKIHKNICEEIENMENGLYHWDHKPRNMGWSDNQQKYVIFDLEDTLWGPRFYNIGMWLGGSDNFEEKYAPREELAKVYLDIYNQENNKNISIDCLLHETFPLWVAYKIETLFHYFHECGLKPYGLRNREPNKYKKEMEYNFVYNLNLLCNLKKD